MKRGIRKLVSTVLVASMVLASAATSALAAEPDSVKEFRQGKTKMAAINGEFSIVVLQEDGTLWGSGVVTEGYGGEGLGCPKPDYTGEGVQMDGTQKFCTYPTKLLEDVVSFSSSSDITAAIKTDGSLWCTGDFTTFDYDSGEWQRRKTFEKVMDNVSSVSVDGNSVFVVKNDASLWAWGDGRYGALGVYERGLNDLPEQYQNIFTGTITPDPVKVLDDVVKTSGRSALKSDGSLWTWGLRDYGVVGDGPTGSDQSDRVCYSPVKILDNVIDMRMDYYYGVAVKKDGSLWAWGTVPGVSQVHYTPYHYGDHLVDYCVGSGNIFTLSDGGVLTKVNGWNAEKSKEEPQIYMDNVRAVEAYNSKFIIVKNDGSLWCMGSNDNYTFGLGVTEDGTYFGEPKQLTGFGTTQPEETSPVQQTATATPTASKVLVNSKEISFDAYEINGNNYFKLRDIASVVNGTGKQFEVTWDGAKNAINLLSDKAYTAVGGELAKGDGSQKTATLNTSKVHLDSKEISLTAYTINDNNYFKLRDLGQTFNFGVGWDGAANTVTIDTSTGYTAE